MKTVIAIIGLTGATGAGKSSVASHLRRKGVPVYDADAAVREILKNNSIAIKKIARLFPKAIDGGKINRQALAKSAFASPAATKALENILHPLVMREEKAFIAKAKRDGQAAAVLEVPLLFESGADVLCDATICLDAPLKVRKERAMKRSGMTAARFAAMRQRQMKDAERRRRADFVVNSDRSIAAVNREIERIIAEAIGSLV